MKVTVNVSVAGRMFSYDEGDVVDEAVFSAKVGSGWQALCRHFRELESADKEPAPETAVKRRRRK